MKIHNVAAVIAIAIASIGVNADQTSRRLIVGGESVIEGQYNYTVGIRAYANGCTNCVGILIHEFLVLTSAACATNVSDEVQPRFAAINQKIVDGTDIETGEVIEVNRVIFHPTYDEKKVTNDVALLVLKNKSRIKPAKLGCDPKPGSKVWAFGWGKTNSSHDFPSHTLQRVQFEVKTNDFCDMYEMLTPTNLCVGGEEGKDICDNDYGGPLIAEGADKNSNDDDRVVGIIGLGIGNFGEACGVGVPSLSTRISFALNWINEVIDSFK
ncbi:hypothetical protein CCR75_007298 [Bremia lactucae]|uniref:Peptidase S1 domain-containing protein n=1 Tax=Bremia lactucae TaxID=4779 RepID=A0A976FHY9_BRELC|nr:hypothetical protein CCR75_007299 [Bremia lactucae]TDH67072.1 hypothetical protein CCR75_007298 [Bremia lactucae]